MTDIWEAWKDICHSNHVMKIKVKVLGPEPKKKKKICVCARGCWCANVSHIEKVWIGRCDVERGHKRRCLSLGSQRNWMSYHGNYLSKAALVYRASTQGSRADKFFFGKRKSKSFCILYRCLHVVHCLLWARHCLQRGVCCLWCRCWFFSTFISLFLKQCKIIFYFFLLFL